ncbi:MAG: twin-arginine translocase subunit TatC [Coriobacteriia bacterium]|nr:twin-arginine translocase subunit TatC [Coriobacteriia bacterium]
MPLNPRIMPFMAHFRELRRRFTYILAVLVLSACLFYTDFFYAHIMQILLWPMRDVLPSGALTVLGPFEAMTFRFKVALYAALVVTAPVIIYHIFAFIMPAIKKNMRRWLIPTVMVAIMLFLAGAAFAYFIIMEPAFTWLFSQAGDVVTMLAAADRYLSGIVFMLIGFGIAFELPLVVFYLIGWGIVPFDTLLKSWRIAIIIVLTVAAIATPDWSPITMMALAGSLLVLYFASLALARIVFAEKIKERRRERAEVEAMYATNEESTTPGEEPDLPADFDQLSRKEQLIAQAEARTRSTSATASSGPPDASEAASKEVT